MTRMVMRRRRGDEGRGGMRRYRRKRERGEERVDDGRGDEKVQEEEGEGRRKSR